MIRNTSKLSPTQLSCTTAIFVVGGFQFGSTWMIGLKWSLLFVPTWLEVQRSKAILFLNCCQFGARSLFGMKWSLWPVPTSLEVQQSKPVFFLTLYYSINYKKHFINVCITPQPCHSHFYVDCCQFCPRCMFRMKMELMACTDLVGGTTEQTCLFPNLIW